MHENRGVGQASLKNSLASVDELRYNVNSIMKRGRPPIGDKAMSTAERQRRFLDKIRGTSTAAPSSQLEAKCAKLKSENAKLKSDNAKLKRENAAIKRLFDVKRQFREISAASYGVVFLKQGDRRKILSALHPDGVENPAAKRRLEMAAQIIGELFNSGKLREED
jgi:hypothetical protein